MRRLVAIGTAVSFALAAPAFGETVSAAGPQQQPSETEAQPLLLEGQDAMAQVPCAPGDTTCGFWNSNGVWVVVGVAGTIGLVGYLASRKNSVSP